MIDILINLYCFVAGGLYPIYKSLSCIDTSSSNQTKQWMTYWVLYTIYNFGYFILGLVLCWIPFYSIIKAIAITYLVHPNTLGAEKMYNIVFNPIFDHYQEREIDLDSLEPNEKDIYIIIISILNCIDSQAKKINKKYPQLNDIIAKFKNYSNGDNIKKIAGEYVNSILNQAIKNISEKKVN